MAKGIRQFVEARFIKLLPKLQDMGGTGFRRKLLDDTVAQFDISINSAAAAYNYVIQKMREEQPKAVAGLGRTDAGLNVLGTGSSRQPRLVQANAARGVRATTIPGNVTLIKANDGTVMVPSIPRPLAKVLIENSGGRGRGNPRLVIKEDQEEMA